MRFIDSNVFVYSLMADPRHGLRAKQILKRVEEGEETAASTLVLSQVCGYLRWKRKSDIIPLFLEFLKGLTSCKKVDTTILDFEDAKLLQSQGVFSWESWDDLVLASQMKGLGVGEIYSNDRDFDRIPGVRRIF